MKHKHTLLLSALMLTALTSVFVGTGATAYAAEVCTHEYDEHIIEATCTEMGYTEYVCSLCGESYKDNYTEAKGHTYTETETQATCTEKGYITYVCDDCGYTYTSVNAIARTRAIPRISVRIAVMSTSITIRKRRDILLRKRSMKRPVRARDIRSTSAKCAVIPITPT